MPGIARGEAFPFAPSDLERLAQEWRFWARPAQLPPAAPWRIWVVLGGRGAGKTRAAAEWVRDHALTRPQARIALVGASHHDVREVMIEGHSGLLKLSPPRPHYEASRRRLVWPNGAQAFALSAEDPESLRGPQFDAAWADELCAWTRPDKVLETLHMGLRLGAAPRLVVTTTPRAIPALKSMIAQPGSVVTRSATRDNAANLAPGFVEAMEAFWGASRLGRQELAGEIVDDRDGALWRIATLARARIAVAPPLDRIVVGVDPPASVGPKADACGIVAAGVAGRGREACAYVLADCTMQGLTPRAWAERAAALAATLGAAAIVAESNQGGEMVREVLEIAAGTTPVKLVRAVGSKSGRAAPVATLYEVGRIRHLPGLDDLEDEMLRFGTDGMFASPDRVDALVWALSDLLFGKADPRIAFL